MPLHPINNAFTRFSYFYATLIMLRSSSSLASRVFQRFSRRCFVVGAQDTTGVSGGGNIGIQNQTASSRSWMQNNNSRHRPIAVFMWRLSDGTQANEIHKLVSVHGAVRSVTMQYDVETGKFRNSAVVTFNTHESAHDAIEHFSQYGAILNGTRLAMKWDGTSQRRINSVIARDLERGPGHQVFVKNLFYSTSESQVREAFSAFGEVIKFELLRDPEGLSRGMARVRFARAIDAETAAQGLNSVSFDGRILHVHRDAMYESTGDLKEDHSVMNNKPSYTPITNTQPNQQSFGTATRKTMAPEFKPQNSSQNFVGSDPLYAGANNRNHASQNVAPEFKPQKSSQDFVGSDSMHAGANNMNHASQNVAPEFEPQKSSQDFVGSDSMHAGANNMNHASQNVAPEFKPQKSSQDFVGSDSMHAGANNMNHASQNVAPEFKPQKSSQQFAGSDSMYAGTNNSSQTNETIDSESKPEKSLHAFDGSDPLYAGISDSTHNEQTPSNGDN